MSTVNAILSIILLEPCFAGRFRKIREIYGGSILPSHGECFVPRRRDPVGVQIINDEADEETWVYGTHEYEVLQVSFLISHPFFTPQLFAQLHYL